MENLLHCFQKMSAAEASEGVYMWERAESSIEVFKHQVDDMVHYGPLVLPYRSLEKSFADSSVQANDYEIERRSGRVPARKRVIPNKFRYFN